MHMRRFPVSSSLHRLVNVDGLLHGYLLLTRLAFGGLFSRLQIDLSGWALPIPRRQPASRKIR
eukprot:9475628-Pyramimonas_sp.AAC.1